MSVSLRKSLAAPTRPAPRGEGPLVVTDGELLVLFTHHNDASAFDALLERHGAMVWRVCRQLLRREHDAEDAFQATFLLLVKSARQIGASGSAAGWLFRVAYRTSLHARRRLAARREEALALDPTAPPEEEFPDLTSRHYAGLLAEELRRLPEKYQTPLVMRYLQGQSRRAIAEATDSTIQAVQGRLARGKQLLRRRLVRRGVTLASVMSVLAAREANASQAAALPHVVLQTTSNATALAAGGSLAASVAVVSLFREGTRAMLLASMTKPALAAAACGLAAITMMAPAVEPTRTTSEGVVISAALEQEEPDSPVGTIQLAAGEAPKEREPQLTTNVEASPIKGITGTVQFREGALPADFRFGDIVRSGRKLADAEHSEVLLEKWAKIAEKDPLPVPGDDRPTFKELHTWHTYWESKYDALNSRSRLVFERFNGKNYSEMTEEDRTEIAEAQDMAAEMFRARAEILRYERELKTRAIAESGGNAGSSNSAEAGTRAPLLDEPAVPPSAASAQEVSVEYLESLVEDLNSRREELFEQVRSGSRPEQFQAEIDANAPSLPESKVFIELRDTLKDVQSKLHDAILARAQRDAAKARETLDLAQAPIREVQNAPAVMKAPLTVAAPKLVEVPIPPTPPIEVRVPLPPKPPASLVDLLVTDPAGPKLDPATAQQLVEQIGAERLGLSLGQAQQAVRNFQQLRDNTALWPDLEGAQRDAMLFRTAAGQAWSDPTLAPTEAPAKDVDPQMLIDALQQGLAEMQARAEVAKAQGDEKAHRDAMEIARRMEDEIERKVEERRVEPAEKNR